MNIRILVCLLGLVFIGCTDPPEGREWHIICHSSGVKTYDGYVKENLIISHTEFSFNEKLTGETVYVGGSCIVRSEKTTPDSPTSSRDR